MFTRYLRPGLSLIILMTLVTGIMYPLVITGVSKVAFSSRAEGSLLHKDGVLIGSQLIGQNFTDPKYFWGRPSATSPQPYNGTASGGTNFGPLNPALIDKVKSYAKALRDADPTNKADIPVELVTASTSGLDPEISPAAAYYQAWRIARARDLSVDTVRAIIGEHQIEPMLGVFGEPRVNVLELNMALDQRR
ncbi:MAG TPA: potassium-transporting ATPase subunit KdpC [Pirellulales bacterium]